VAVAGHYSPTVVAEEEEEEEVPPFLDPKGSSMQHASAFSFQNTLWYCGVAAGAGRAQLKSFVQYCERG
jgi:hypothetical protein